MGADIHFVVELKFSNRWIGVYASDLRLSLASSAAADKHVTLAKSAELDAYDRHYDSTSYDMQDPAMGHRHYDFFSALAGVRGTGPAPRGLPEDVSELTNAMLDDYGWHSHSWDTLRDFLSKWVITRYPEVIGVRMTAGDAAYEKLLDSLAGGYVLKDGEFRVVYWFDN